MLSSTKQETLYDLTTLDHLMNNRRFNNTRSFSEQQSVLQY